MFGGHVPFGRRGSAAYERKHFDIRSERTPKDPKLALVQEAVRRVAGDAGQPDPEYPVRSSEELERICAALILHRDSATLREILGPLADAGSGDERAHRDLAAAARMLGDWWLEDRASFVDVTIGTGWIFEFLRDTRDVPPSTKPRSEPPLVFASVPGEQHTLGVRMAADSFRGDGWDIALKIGLGQEDLVAYIKQRPDCIVGLSIAGRHSLPALFRLVDAINMSCPHASIVACGHGIDELRQQLSSVELDDVASEINESKVKISALWDRKFEITSASLGIKVCDAITR